MRNALFMFGGMLLAVVIGLALFHSIVDRPTPLQRSVQATTEQDRVNALMRADFVQASDSMRMSFAEYYMSTGHVPKDNAAAGLPAPDQYRGQTLKSATIDSAGAIDFVFDANSGKDGGRIRLIADLSHVEAMGVQWRCETNDYSQIKPAIACNYVAR